ncbi:MAG: hypothetical protein CGW95_05960 [Phenylobacterium zucineum]|nr:MAG: hypothetical protein CGW95_05960 [Phenylobacterium zucineum]
MTETSPLGTQATPNHIIAAMSPEDQLKYQLKQGRPPLGIDLKLEDDDGKRLPRDGHTFGKLMVKGPFVVGEYFRGDGGDILDKDGFFDTGDVATLDSNGFMQITDRSKDVIKSGGEWISSIEIENIAAGHPKADLAAVIGVFHPKWDERPLLLVKLKAGVEATKDEFLKFLDGKIAKWWTPDDVVFVDDIPLGATGKIDKKLIRQRMADYVLPAAPATAAAATVTKALAAAPEPKIYAPKSSGPAGGPRSDPDTSPAAAVESELADLPVVEVTAGAEVDPPAATAEPKAEALKSRPWLLYYLNFALASALLPSVIMLSIAALSQIGAISGSDGAGSALLAFARGLAPWNVAAAAIGVISTLMAKDVRRYGVRALLILVLALATAGFYAWANQVLTRPQDATTGPAVVRIPSGETRF